MSDPFGPLLAFMTICLVGTLLVIGIAQLVG